MMNHFEQLYKTLKQNVQIMINFGIVCNLMTKNLRHHLRLRSVKKMFMNSL